MTSHTCQAVSSPIQASVTVPGSKSISNRALICAAFAHGTSRLTNFLSADDTKAMVAALETLGVKISIDEDRSIAEISGIRGQLPVNEATIDAHGAGTVMRFLTAMLSTTYGTFELHGDDRMHRRPIGQLVDLVRSLGAGVEYLGEEKFPPIKIYANHLRGGYISITDAISSQFVSALMMAAPLAQGDVLLDVIGPLPSAPYVRMTASVMDSFGVSVVEQYDENLSKLIVPAPQNYQAAELRIEPDASTASYFLAAPAIVGGSVTIEGLGTQSCQGDIGFVDILEEMGCTISRYPAELTVTGPASTNELRGVDVDLGHMPDIVPTLAAVALFASTPTRIRNVAGLRHKESDRIGAIATELARLGAEVRKEDDGLTISPCENLKLAPLNALNDHRLAMSYALIGLRLPGLVIEGANCCAKTFPGFFQCWDRMCKPES